VGQQCDELAALKAQLKARRSRMIEEFAALEARVSRMTDGEFHDSLIDALEELEEAERSLYPPLKRKKPRRGRPSDFELDLKHYDQMRADNPGHDVGQEFILALESGQWRSKTSHRQALKWRRVVAKEWKKRFGRI
jgi:hypothetical protein